MKKTTIFLFAVILIIGFLNHSVAQDEAAVNKKPEVLFTNSVYLDAGYGIGRVSAFWSGYSYSAISVKAGNRFKMIGTDYSTYNLGIQLTWVYYSFNQRIDLSNKASSYWIGVAGIGISNMFRIKRNLGFEVNINLIPQFLEDSDNQRVYIGPMGNLELRFRFKKFYLGLDSGVSINFGSQTFIFGAHTGLKLGVNLF